MSLIKNRKIVDDPFVRLADGDELSEVPAIISKTRFLAEREGWLARNQPLGLLIKAGETLDGLAQDLNRFAVIALDLPIYRDGRAYSTARLLRERHGFAGELRAVGNVLRDQITFMRRVGFDAFDVTHRSTIDALLSGETERMSVFYQPATTDSTEIIPAGTRPWLRVAN